MSKEQNLYDALAILGITASADAGTPADQRRVWTKGDDIIGRFTADEGWQALKAANNVVESLRTTESNNEA